MDCLFKQNELKEALDYTEELLKNPYFPNESKIIEYRGRALLYSGDEAKGLKFLDEALKSDPYNNECYYLIQDIRKAQEMKAEANELFKRGECDEALAIYEKCLEFDRLNFAFNAIVYYNMAISKYLSFYTL